jgi:GT2 family glycosyltransferase
MTPRVTAIIPTLNRKDLLVRAVETFREHHSDDECHIIVIENGSDGSDKWCQENGVEVIKPDFSLTFGASNNLAAKQVKSELILMLNNDVICTRNILRPLIATMEAHPRCVMVGAKLLHEDGKIQHAGVEFSREGIPHHVLYRSDADLPCWQFDRPVNAVTAACVLVKRRAWEQVHGFDPRYQSNYEDVDLCLKFRERGWEIWWSHEAEMIHLENQTRGEAGDIRPMLEVFMAKWVATKNLYYLARDGKLALNYPERRLNICDGRNPWPGYLNVAPREAHGVDYIRKVDRGLPFDDQSVVEINCSETIHLFDGDTAWVFLTECWRVLKPGGRMTLSAPVAFSGGPNQKSFWTEDAMGPFLGVLPFKVTAAKTEDDLVAWTMEKGAFAP